MVMKFVWHDKAKKDFSKIGKPEQTRIVKKLLQVEGSDDPLSFLDELTEDLAGCYKLRVGKYRIINFFISDDIAYIVLIQIRGKVYSANEKGKVFSRIQDVLDNQK